MSCGNCSSCNGCSSCHRNGCGGCSQALTELEKTLLNALSERAFLPIARLVLVSTEEPDLSFVMSAPVYLPDKHTKDAERKALGRSLLALQKRGYITLDYDLPLQGFDYDEWRDSDFYQRVSFSLEAPDVMPKLEGGSVALTVQGQQVIDELELG